MFPKKQDRTTEKQRIQRQWDIVKRRWHASGWTGHIHHVYGRVGILKCCAALMVGLTPTQHDDPAVKKRLREEHFDLKCVTLRNYIKNSGCENATWMECRTCLMKRENYK